MYWLDVMQRFVAPDSTLAHIPYRKCSVAGLSACVRTPTPPWLCPSTPMPQVATAAASPAGKRIRCSQLGAPGVVLAGDAAHAVTPVFGQGANSSLESARVLGLALEEAKVRTRASNCL